MIRNKWEGVSIQRSSCTNGIVRKSLERRKVNVLEMKCL